MTNDNAAVFGPGSILGVLGGGQLGRMIALAAAPLGIRVHVYAPDAESPAAEVSAFHTRAAYDDEDALARFAEAVDVVTLEFENVPAATAAFLATRVPVRPGARALEIAQDRLAEKRFVKGLAGTPAPFAPVDSLDDLTAALAEIGTPAILKTRRLGYDGKGQARIMTPGDAASAFEALGGKDLVLEGFVDFTAEFSIVLARTPGGETRAFPAAVNEHEGGVLATSTVPAAGVSDMHVRIATAMTGSIAAALDYVGVMAVEFFATPALPIFNEMAPRVHNSGHWTIEGCQTSQFEQHVRAVCGLPLGAVGLRGESVVMHNLLGEAADGWDAFLREPGAHLHLYGKSEAKAGRKMGHVTMVTERKPAPANPVEALLGGAVQEIREP